MASREEKLESRRTLVLCLPPLSEEDPLFAKKKRLSCARNLKFNFEVSIPLSLEEANQLLDGMIVAARITCLNEAELYFLDDDDFGPFSPRNELESLNSVLVVIDSSLACAEADTTEVLHVLRNAICAMVKSVGDQYDDEMVSEKADTCAEGLLLEWSKVNGARTKLDIAYFEGAGRGAVALEDINIGDTALEIPESLIISEDLIYNSDMFDVLNNLDGITAETMLLLWSMRERYNSNSKFKSYFKTLPEKFSTGLSFGIDALSLLEGTLLFEELLQAREHLHEQYDALCPPLCTSYPDIFQPELYTWDKFLWACELWYSHSMKVVFADGKLRTCLVPIAGFLNHSLCPHIVQYGRVDSATKFLKFHLSRRCKRGDQCYLSYGSFPGSHLLIFYGFLPKGDNPYDVIPIDIDASHAEDGSSQSQMRETGWTTHMVRGTWLSKTKKPHTYGLPPPLLHHLHAVLKVDDIQNNELPPEISGQDTNKDTDRAVLEMIQSIFNSMMEGLGHVDDVSWKNSTWDVQLALDYKHLYRRIISSVLDACAAALCEMNDL